MLRLLLAPDFRQATPVLVGHNSISNTVHKYIGFFFLFASRDFFWTDNLKADSTKIKEDCFNCLAFDLSVKERRVLADFCKMCF